MYLSFLFINHTSKNISIYFSLTSPRVERLNVVTMVHIFDSTDTE